MTAGDAALLPPLPGVTHHWLDGPGVRLHYAESAAGSEGDAVVLLHGFPELWYAWRHQLVALGATRRVVAPVLRGAGAASAPADVSAYALPALVDDVRRLADRLGGRRIVLVGHDWGGVIAWAFAARHPQRVSRLVIVNAPHPATFARELRRSPRQMLASAYVLLFRAPFGLAERVLRFNDHAALEPLLRRGLARGYFTPADAEVYRAAWRVPGALTAALNYYRALRQGRGAAMVPVRVPTTVLWGERDRYLRPGLLDGLDHHVPGVRVIRVPEASHWIVQEQPALVTQVIAGAVRPLRE